MEEDRMQEMHSLFIATVHRCVNGLVGAELCQKLKSCK
jgi:hypothetical protein